MFTAENVEQKNLFWKGECPKRNRFLLRNRKWYT